jgi:hypothetical protein
VILAPFSDELLDSALDAALAAGWAEAARLGSLLCWPCFIHGLALRLVSEVLPLARERGEIEPSELWRTVSAAGTEVARGALLVAESGEPQ